ncbi:MAG: hypothetical protein ABIC04_07275 [Nanoarchaeota archaeon]
MKKKRHLLLIILIFLTVPAYGQSDLENFNQENLIIAPPPPPIETPQYIVRFELREYSTKNLISDIHIETVIQNLNTGDEIQTLKYVSENGILSFDLIPSNWIIKLRVDKLDTTGKDYFQQKEYSVDRSINETLYLLPVGSLRGTVYDNEKVVQDALIKFDCLGQYGQIEEIKTNNFGSFANYWLPIGSCKISAISGKKMGYQNVLIEQGGLTDTEILLTHGVAVDNNWVYILAPVILVFVYFFMLKKPVSKKVLIKEDVLKERSSDIIKTVSEKEKKIIEFLLKEKSTQSKIKNELAIPKTTLARLLQGLELKNIIKVEKVGKLKKVELTVWFLGKEELDCK